MWNKNSSFQVIIAIVMIGLSGSCVAGTVGQNYQKTALPGQNQPSGDITGIQDRLLEINTILKKVLGTDSHRQTRLVRLRILSAGGKILINDVTLTLKKNAYDLTSADMENLKILLQAVNANQAIVFKRLLRSTSTDFPVAAKQQLNKAINNILTFSRTVYEKPARTPQSNSAAGGGRKTAHPPVKTESPQQDNLSEEILMQPIIPEHLTFDYYGRTSNQLTPAAMCILDLEFLKQTGEGEIPLLRNVGTLKLLLLAYAQILKGIHIYQANDTEKDKIAELLLNDELRYFPVRDRTITNEKINQIYDRVRGKILARVTPQVSCQAVRKKFGLD